MNFLHNASFRESRVALEGHREGSPHNCLSFLWLDGINKKILKVPS